MIVFLSILLEVILLSCNDGNAKPTPRKILPYTVEKVTMKQSGVTDKCGCSGNDYTFSHIDYNGHDIIKVNYGDGAWSFHNPDCSIEKSYNQLIKQIAEKNGIDVSNIQ